ncbi:MAG: TRAP transporter small permease subunit [Hyphomicrobiales bacterium]|nr:TRAP transporter small permease subunit [Hyphomicrobiales bacterium]
MRLLDRLEEAIIAFLIAAATTTIFVAVVHRYGLSSAAKLIGFANSMEWTTLAGLARSTYKWLAGFNLTWAQELTIYMFVWMAKFGAAYGVRTGIHVGVDVLINALDARTRVGFILFGLGAGALFTGIVGALGANFVWKMAATGQTSADLEVPMWIVYLCVPLGSWLMSFRFLQVAVSFVRTGHLPKHDHGHVAGLEEEAAS